MVQYLSGSETTRRENLLDTITVRAAFQTPLLRQLPQETTSSVITEWSVDEPFKATESVRSLANPHPLTKKEGTSFAYRTPYYPTRLRSICEIKHEGMEMSGTDRNVNMAGVASTWDYRAGQLYTKLLNAIDHTLMYGVGSPTTDGSTDERQTQGLISWAAWTGLERMHSASGITEPQMTDPYNVSIPSSMWSVFYDAAHSNLTQDLFYNNIMSPLLNAGADMETSPWIFMAGYRLMGRIARFLIADGAIPLNERERNADDGMGSDYLNWFRFPSGHVVGFRTNRWLNDTGNTYSFTNTDYTPGAPTSPGTLTRTLYGDQTLIGYEPGSVVIQWYREPGFKQPSIDGDYNRIAAVAEFGLKVRHPLCVGGGANLLA